MRVIDLGQTGEAYPTEGIGWDELGLSSRWLSLINRIAPCSKPHDVQVKVLRDCQMLELRRNLIISGPTNSGKSLLGYLAIFSGLKEGQRALLIEPFKALAQEKFDELTELLPKIKKDLSILPGIEITTGDYRINGETLMEDPPQNGEIVIATPERIDAIMRNPDFDSWITSFGIVCIDEAHLISDEKRGPSLENVITLFLCEKAPPRLVLLSATLGNCDLAKDWLKPCDIVKSTVRRPPLHLNVIVVDKNEKANDAVLTTIEKELSDSNTSALVFVYRTDDANRLAKLLTDKLGPKLDNFQAAAYHSKMPLDKKAFIKASFENGQIRCLVSTTALGAGVNMPVTHVIIRDLTFGTEGPLPIREILQMLGRAGRKNTHGWSAVVLKSKETWEEAIIAEQITTPTLPNLESALISKKSRRDYRSKQRGIQDLQTPKLILGRLVRQEQQTIDNLRIFFNRSLGGKKVQEYIETGVRWLCDSQRALAWEDNQGIGATTLGKAIARTGIPLEVGAGFGALIRDILSCDPSDSLLAKWKPLDALIVLELLDPREKGIKRFSKDLPERIDAWVERDQMKPVLFTEWIRGSNNASSADEVLGSLGINLSSQKDFNEVARKYTYMATLRAIIIFQLGKGLLSKDVARRWNVKGLEGVQERWRDHLLWQLAGIAEILDIRCFYYFLCKECDANDARISTVKKIIMQMRFGVFDLLGLLRFCSPLGPLFRDLEAAKAGVGISTMKKLESAGVGTFAEINKMSIDNLKAIGIRIDIARKLKNYIKKRSL